MEHWDVATSCVEEKRRFIARFDDRDKSEGPPIAINSDSYNSLDGRLRLISI